MFVTLIRQHYAIFPAAGWRTQLPLSRGDARGLAGPPRPQRKGPHGNRCAATHPIRPLTLSRPARAPNHPAALSPLQPFTSSPAMLFERPKSKKVAQRVAGGRLPANLTTRTEDVTKVTEVNFTGVSYLPLNLPSTIQHFALGRRRGSNTRGQRIKM